MASIKLILRTTQTDASEHAPLYIRIIKDRKTKFISAGVKLKPSEWDEKKQRVKKNHPNSARMNALLLQKMADAEGHVADSERKSRSVSAKRLKDVIKGIQVPNFFKYAYARCNKIKPNVSYNTYSTYSSNLKKFETFMGTNDVYFDDITVTTLNDYIMYMGTTLKNGATTQFISIKILAIFFKDAQQEDLIPETLYPFNKIKLKKNDSKKLFLNKEQITKLAAIDFYRSTTAGIFRDMFLFAIYAGGLRFSDVLELQYIHYLPEESRIKKQIRKTSRTHQFKIGSTAIDILNKYMLPDGNPDDFIFPIIKDKDFHKLSKERQFIITRAASRLSQNHLSKIGTALKLPFPLSFHLSRHTFATNALNNGMRIEHVSKLMDHSDISTTQIYAKIISEELDKAVDNFVY